MSRLSEKERQIILDDFARRHGGRFDAGLFLSEVQASNGSHPAWEWFDWDDAEAAHQHRLSQARAFVRNLRVSFHVKTVDRGPVIIKRCELPAVVSPPETRHSGGGYLVTDPENPEVMNALCREAATSLRAWLRRYGGVMEWIGESSEGVEATAKALEDHLNKKDTAA